VRCVTGVVGGPTRRELAGRATKSLVVQPTNLPRAYLMNAALAWVGAVILVVFARESTRKSV
jgi:hypothetical protein